MSANDSKSLWLELEKDIRPTPQELGPYTTQAYQDDPCALAFITSRYKFCSKILMGKNSVLEIGCGDGFGSALVAQNVNQLICTDINSSLLNNNTERMNYFSNIEFKYHDFRLDEHSPQVDGIYSVDVIEHIYSSEEEKFLRNICNSLADNGVCLFGTPNKTADQYASKFSQVGHVNLKNHSELRSIGKKYFFNHFLFGMNDEVIHTGYPQMAHFLWLLGVGPRLGR